MLFIKQILLVNYVIVFALQTVINSQYNECTYDYYEDLYWVKTEENYKPYECQKFDSINFIFFEKVNGLNAEDKEEMTKAF